LAKKISFVKVAGIGFHAKAQSAQRKSKAFKNLAFFAARVPVGYCANRKVLNSKSDFHADRLGVLRKSHQEQLSRKDAKSAKKTKKLFKLGVLCGFACWKGIAWN
jgi:hypothetical protein